MSSGILCSFLCLQSTTLHPLSQLHIPHTSTLPGPAAGWSSWKCHACWPGKRACPHWRWHAWPHPVSTCRRQSHSWQTGCTQGPGTQGWGGRVEGGQAPTLYMCTWAEGERRIWECKDVTTQWDMDLVELLVGPAWQARLREQNPPRIPQHLRGLTRRCWSQSPWFSRLHSCWGLCSPDTDCHEPFSPHCGGRPYPPRSEETDTLKCQGMIHSTSTLFYTHVGKD